MAFSIKHPLGTAQLLGENPTQGKMSSKAQCSENRDGFKPLQTKQRFEPGCPKAHPNCPCAWVALLGHIDSFWCSWGFPSSAKPWPENSAPLAQPHRAFLGLPSRAALPPAHDLLTSKRKVGQQQVCVGWSGMGAAETDPRQA